MVKLLITADFARFTNHGEKNDLTTYDVPTPSSLTGLVTSIYGKPEFNWEIRSITVLNPIKRVRMTTNGWCEVKYDPDKDFGDHTQNARVYLKDVAYLVEVEPYVPNYADNLARRAEGINLEKKHEEILRRRLRDGLVGSRRNSIFLGKNDCPCSVTLVENDSDIPESHYKDKKPMKFNSIPVLQSFTPLEFENPVKTLEEKHAVDLANLAGEFKGDTTTDGYAKKKNALVKKHETATRAAKKKYEGIVAKLLKQRNVFKSRFDGVIYQSHFHHKNLVMINGKITLDREWYTVWAQNGCHSNNQHTVSKGTSVDPENESV